MQPSRPSGQGARSARVADREDLPQVAVVVLPVEIPPTEAGIDLHVVLATGAASIREPARLDPAEDGVEVVITDVKAVVMALELLAPCEIDRQRVVDVDRLERLTRRVPRDVEQAGQELCPADGFVRGNDEVIESDRHATPPGCVSGSREEP